MLKRITSGSHAGVATATQRSRSTGPKVGPQYQGICGMSLTAPRYTVPSSFGVAVHMMLSGSVAKPNATPQAR